MLFSTKNVRGVHLPSVTRPFPKGKEKMTLEKNFNCI